MINNYDQNSANRLSFVFAVSLNQLRKDEDRRMVVKIMARWVDSWDECNKVISSK
jgi:hypothetical protein